jgi:hypothetical protein
MWSIYFATNLDGYFRDVSYKIIFFLYILGVGLFYLPLTPFISETTRARTNLVEKKCKQGISSESKEKNLSKSDLKVLALF